MGFKEISSTDLKQAMVNLKNWLDVNFPDEIRNNETLLQTYDKNFSDKFKSDVSNILIPARALAAVNRFQRTNRLLGEASDEDKAFVDSIKGAASDIEKLRQKHFPALKAFHIIK